MEQKKKKLGYQFEQMAIQRGPWKYLFESSFPLYKSHISQQPPDKGRIETITNGKMKKVIGNSVEPGKKKGSGSKGNS